MRARWCAVAGGKTGPWSLRERACAVASSALPGLPCGCRCEIAVRAAGMFRKARRVNVRKRNDSEEEERERDEEQEPPPLLPPPGTGEEPGAGGSDRAPAGESLLGPGLPPPSALTPGFGGEAGGCFPGSAEPGNGLKPRKRPRENKEVPRASLLSFQDEEEGSRRTSGPQTLASLHQHRQLNPPNPRVPRTPSPRIPERNPFPPDLLHICPRLRPSAPAGDSFPRHVYKQPPPHRPSVHFLLRRARAQISHPEFFKWEFSVPCLVGVFRGQPKLGPLTVLGAFSVPSAGRLCPRLLGALSRYLCLEDRGCKEQ